MAAGNIESEVREEQGVIFDGDDGEVYVTRAFREHQRVKYVEGSWGDWKPVGKRRLLLPDGRQVMGSGDDTFHIRNTTSPILTERKENPKESE